MSGCLAASVHGHIVNTMTHTVSVAEVLRRIVNEFPIEEPVSHAYDLITSLKVSFRSILSRRRILSGRFAIRELMVFTDYVREPYISQLVENWTTVTGDLFKAAQTTTIIVAQSLAEHRDQDAGRSIDGGNGADTLKCPPFRRTDRLVWLAPMNYRGKPSCAWNGDGFR